MHNTVYDTFIGKTFMRWLALIIFKVSGWEAAGQRPSLSKYVLIAAPHTSNWDFLYTLCLAFILGIKPRIMMKSTWFRRPLAPFLRWLGAFPVDRSGSHDVVAQSIQAFNEQDRLVMLIPPSGTRKKVMYWKTGFYHIARGAGVQVVLGYLDYGKKIGGIGPAFSITGRAEADMKTIQGFYADKMGKYPRKNDEPVVVSESKMLP
jgi:1-acyl-sn-glycerol-3-phosphate acyltransferase